MQYLLFGLIVFSPLAFGATEPWSLAAVEISIFIIFAHTIKKPSKIYNCISYKTLLPAILFVGLIGILQSITEIPINHPESAMPFTVWRPSTIKAVILWLSYAALIWSVPQIIKTSQQFKKALWVVFATGVILSLIGILQKRNPSAIYGFRKLPWGAEAFGPFVNRNNAADFLLMSAMVGIGIFISRFSQLYKYQSRSRFFDFMAVQFLILVMLLITTYAIVKTGSRGALHSLVFAVSLTAFLLSFSNRIKTFIPAIIIGALVTGYGTYLLKNKMLVGITHSALLDNSTAIRLSMYKSGLEMLGDFPVFGVGLGAVANGFPYYQEKIVKSLVEHVHSDWLELLLEVGIIGAALFLAGFLLMIKNSFKQWKNCPSIEIFFLSGGILSGTLACVFHNIVDFGFQIPAISFTFYFLLAALSSKPVEQGKSEERETYSKTYYKIGTARKYIFPVSGYLLAIAAIIPAIGWCYSLAAKKAPYEKKPALYKKAILLNGDPRYIVRLGASHYNEAVKNPKKSQELLQKSLLSIMPYTNRLTVHKDLKRLEKSILYYLKGKQ